MCLRRGKRKDWGSAIVPFGDGLLTVSRLARVGPLPEFPPAGYPPKGIILHYFQFNIGDYASHTKSLSLLEDLAYRRLLDEYYLHEHPLIGSPTDVARQIGMRDQKDEVEYVLRMFFLSTETGWVNKRADAEIAHFRSKIEQASKAGKASAERRINGRSTDVQPTNNQQPITNNQQPSLKPKTATASPLPDWLPEAEWKDYLESRKVMKSPMTDRAKVLAINKLDELRRQGNKPTDVLNQSIYNGWKGLFPIKTETKGKGKSRHEHIADNWAKLTGRNNSADAGTIEGTAERVD